MNESTLGTGLWVALQRVAHFFWAVYRVPLFQNYYNIQVVFPVPGFVVLDTRAYLLIGWRV